MQPWGGAATQRRVGSVRFTLASPEEMVRHAVVNVTDTAAFDSKNPSPAGPFARVLGPCDEKDKPCPVCKKPAGICWGHTGVLDIQAAPKTHPEFWNYIAAVLRNLCFYDLKLLICSPHERTSIKFKLTKTRNDALEHARDQIYGKEAQSMEGEALYRRVSSVLRPQPTCEHCGRHQPKFKVQIGVGQLTVTEHDAKARVLTPIEIRNLLERVSDKTYKAMGIRSGVSHPVWVILSLLIHPPTCLFPPKTSGGKVAPDYMQSHLCDIVNYAKKEATARAAKDDGKERDFSFIAQAKIRQYISESSVQAASQAQHHPRFGQSKQRRYKIQRKRNAVAKRVHKDQPMKKDETPVVPPAKATSTRKMLDDKEGHARAAMLGHVNEEVARAVIHGDPYLKLGHSGAPGSMMFTLIKPIRAWPYNMRMLQDMVDKGPAHPFGARSVLQQDGRRRMLDPIRRPQLKFPERMVQAISATTAVTEPLSEKRPKARYQRQLSRRPAKPAPTMVRSTGRILLRPGDLVERHFGVVIVTAGERVYDHMIEGRHPSASEAAMQCNKAEPRPDSKGLKIQVTEAEKSHADLDGDEKHVENPQNLRAEVEAQDLMAADMYNVCSMDNSNYTRLIQGGVVGIFDLTSKDTFLTAPEMMHYMMTLAEDNTAVLPEPAIRVRVRGKWVEQWTGAQLFNKFLPANLDYELHAEVPDKHVLIREGELLHGQISGDVVGKSEQSIIVKMWHYFPRHVHTDFVYRAQLLGTEYATKCGVSTGVGELLDIHDRASEADRRALDELETDETTTFAEKTQLVAGIMSRLHKSTLDNKEFRQQATAMERMVRSKARGKLLNVAQMVNVVGQQNRDGSPWLYGRPTPHFLQTQTVWSMKANGFILSSFLRGMDDLEYFAAAQVAREQAIAAKRGVPDSGYAARRIASTGGDFIVKYDFTVRNSSMHIASFRFGGDGVNPRHGKRVVVPHQGAQDRLALDAGDHECIQSWFASWAKRPDMTSMSVNALDLLSSFAKPRARFTTTAVLTAADIRNRTRRLCQLLALPHSIVSRSDARQLVDVQHDMPGQALEYMASKWFRDNDTTQMLRVRLCRDLEATDLCMNRERWNAFAVAILNEHWRSMAEPGMAVGASLGPSITNRLLQTSMDAEKTAGQNQVTAAQGLPLAMEILGASKPRNPSVTLTVSTVCRNCRFRAQVLSCPHVDIAAAKKHLTRSLQCVTLSSLAAELLVRTEDAKTPLREQDVPLLMHAQRVVAFRALSSVFLSVTIKRRALTDKDHHERCSQLMQTAIAALKPDAKLPFALRLVDTHQVITDSSRRAACHEYVGRVYFALPSEDYVETETQRAHARSYFASKLPELRHLTLAGHNKITRATISAGAVDTHVDLGGKGGTSGGKFWHLAKLMANPLVNGRGCSSNTIHEMNKVLGIEAAREHQFRRLIDVFRTSGEFLDMRFPDLAVDIVTRRGFVSPFTKSSVDIKEGGACMRSSFEGNQANFMQAARRGEVDLLRDPTACIMMGKRSPVGTGAFSMTMDLDMLKREGRVQKWCHQPMPRPEDFSNMMGLGMDDPLAAFGRRFEADASGDAVMSAMDELMQQAPPPVTATGRSMDLLQVSAVEIKQEEYDPSRHEYTPRSPAYSPSRSPPRSPMYSPSRSPPASPVQVGFALAPVFRPVADEDDDEPMAAAPTADDVEWYSPAMDEEELAAAAAAKH